MLNNQPIILTEPIKIPIKFGDELIISWTVNPYAYTKIKKHAGTAEIVLKKIKNFSKYKKIAYFTILKSGSLILKIYGENHINNESSSLPEENLITLDVIEAENKNYDLVNVSNRNLFAEGGSQCLNEYKFLLEGYGENYLSNIIQNKNYIQPTQSIIENNIPPSIPLPPLTELYPIQAISSNTEIATVYFFTSFYDPNSISLPKPNSAKICNSNYNCNNFNFNTLTKINFRGLTYYHGLIIEPKKEGIVSIKLFHNSDEKFKSQEIPFQVINFNIKRQELDDLGIKPFELDATASEILIDKKIKVGNSTGPFPRYNQINQEIKYYESSINSSKEITTSLIPSNSNRLLVKHIDEIMDEVYFSGTFASLPINNQINTTIIGYQSGNDEFLPKANIFETIAIEPLEVSCDFLPITGSFEEEIVLNKFVENKRYFDNQTFKNTSNVNTGITFSFIDENKFKALGITLSGSGEGVNTQYIVKIPKGKYLQDINESYKISCEIPDSKKYKGANLFSFLSLTKVDTNGRFELGSEAKKDDLLLDTYNIKYTYALPFNFLSDLKLEPVFTLGEPYNNVEEAYEANRNGLNLKFLENDIAKINTISKSILLKKAGTINLTAYLDGGLAYNSLIKTITINIEKNIPQLIFPNISQKKAGDGKFSLNISTNNINGKKNFSISSPIASINEFGIVNILRQGTATITVTQNEDDKFFTKSVSQPLIVAKGNQKIDFQLTKATFALDELPLELFASTNSTNPIIFSSSNPSVARIVDKNTLEFLTVGKTTISAHQISTANFEASEVISIPISVKNKTILNFPIINYKKIGDPNFNLNITSNNPRQIIYFSMNPSVAVVDDMGIVSIKSAGETKIIVHQKESSQFLPVTEERLFIVNNNNNNNNTEVTTYLSSMNKYIDYRAKKYKFSQNDIVYNLDLPKKNEEHVLLLDLNLYGFEEDKIEDCDIELNAQILKTGYFYQMPKDPIFLNFKIEDAQHPLQPVLGLEDLLYQKNIIKNFNVYSNIYYNNYLENSFKFSSNNRIVRTEFEVSKPLASLSDIVGVPILFEYKSNPSKNFNYNIDEYSLIISGIKSEEKTISETLPIEEDSTEAKDIQQSETQYKKADYITGEVTGFMAVLKPGKYVAILSGNEKDFVYNQNYSYAKNQNFNTVQINLEYLSGDKYKKVFLENPDVIWASYNLDYKELIPDSGYEKLTSQNPIGFSIDFLKGISGIKNLSIPNLSYTENSGEFIDLCAVDRIFVTDTDPFCTLKLKFICQLAGTYESSGIYEMDVPRTALPKRKYQQQIPGNSLRTASLLASAEDPSEALTAITYLNDPVDKNFYTIAIDGNLKATCCYCQEQAILGEIKWEDPKQLIEKQLYKGITIEDSGDAIYEKVFFLDDMTPNAIQLKYNFAYYSGYLKLKEEDLYEGDKIIFNQYPFDFEFIYKNLYDSYLPPSRAPVKKEFIYSKVLRGNDYWNGTNELIQRINSSLANKNYYTWKPLKHTKNVEYLYGPLLTGINLGVNDSGENVIGLAALQSGKFGAFDIKLELSNRNAVYPYLLPKVIKMQVSEDGINWQDAVSSTNRLPLNTYLQNPSTEINNIYNIKYNKIEETSVTQTKSVPIGSEIENVVSEEPSLEEDLAEMVTGIASQSPLVSGSSKPKRRSDVYCLPNKTGSGIQCGRGFIDFIVTLPSGASGFKYCKAPSEPCPIWPGDTITDEYGERGSSLSIFYDKEAVSVPYFGYSGSCCTGIYSSTRTVGWCCSGRFSPFNPSGCKPPDEKEEKKQKEDKSTLFQKIKQKTNSYRLAFYDYLSED
jgi:hypothetical protein